MSILARGVGGVAPGDDPDDFGGPGDPGGGEPRTPWWRRRAVILLAVLVLSASSFGLYRWTHSGDQPEAGDGQATRSPRPATTEAREPEAPPTMVPPVSAQPTTTAAPAPATTTSPPTVVVEQPTPIRGTDHQLDFADDFNGSSPDAAVWATAPFGDSLPATVSDGVMTLTTNVGNDYKWSYIASTGPRQDTEPSYTDPKAWETGYFEARLRYTDNPWSWPAFWLFSMTKTEVWPREDCSSLDAEWDIMENGTPHGRPANAFAYTTLHRNTSDGTDDGYCGIPDDTHSFSHEFTDTNLSDWHVWGGRWTGDELCSYLDGVEIECMESWDSTAQPMHLTFTMQYLGWCEGCPPRPDELEMQIDWVRVWRAP